MKQMMNHIQHWQSNKMLTSMLRASLCDYSDTYILVKGTITTSNKGTATSPNNRK